MSKKKQRTTNKQATLAATKSGFTMIEFSIATAFIAVLLISIAIVTSNIITIYQKGLTLKAVNSVGRGLIDEFNSTINAAPAVDVDSLCDSHLKNDNAARSICRADHADKFIFQHRFGNRQAPSNESNGEVQMNGIFCTGKYSYIWNTYYADEAKEKGHSNSVVKIKYRDLGGQPQTLEDFRMARIEDPTYRVCSAVTTDEYQTPWSSGTADNEIDITKLANGTSNNIKTPEQGFLNSFDLDLWLYELTMFPISQDDFTYRTFMSGTFILATERGNINLARSTEYCDVNHLADDETATDLLNIGSEFNYCAINKFNFAARTAGM